MLLLAPPALGYMIWLGPSGHFLTGSWRDTALLLGAGAVTAIPLMLYANGGPSGLRLSTIGILQYIAPDDDLPDRRLRLRRALRRGARRGLPR